MNIHIVGLRVPLQKWKSRAPVTQSVAIRAVNARVVSSNPSSANIILDVWQKSLWQASFVFHSSFTNGLTVYVEKQPVAWKECCVEYWCEKASKHMSRGTGLRVITENVLKTALNFNQSINQSTMNTLCYKSCKILRNMFLVQWRLCTEIVIKLKTRINYPMCYSNNLLILISQDLLLLCWINKLFYSSGQS